MEQFTIMTDEDRREVAAIQRRRSQEEARKKRIFNPRSRLYGVDYEALQKQIAEKRRVELEEERMEKNYIEQQRQYAEIAKNMESEQVELKRKYAAEINEYRLNYQKPEDRREFDLNDPNYIKKGLPARLWDDDPRCTVSSVQKFEGEDFSSKERKDIQRAQLKSWLEQQMSEHDAAETERVAAETAYTAAVIARDDRAIELDNLERRCRQQLEQSCIRYNRALADEREAARAEQRRRDADDNCAEKYNMLTSDLMTENPNQSQSNLGPSRQIGYLYKGMSKEQKEAIRTTQKAQIEEAQKRKSEEARFTREWEEYSNGIQKSVALIDRDMARKQRDRDKEIAEENMRLSVEQKSQQDFLNKVVYTNLPTAAYYNQFNSCTR